MAAPSTPVIQGVNPVYPFGSNVHATWVTDTSVTSGATTLYSGSTVVSTQAASLFDYDAYTKTWKVSYPIAATGTYAIGVTATNGDGTSDEATAQFVVAEYSGIVLSPSGTVTGLPINVAWSIDDPNGVAAQNIVFQPSDYSGVMYSATLPPTQRTLTLGMADLAGIEDGTSYEIRLHVTNGVGLITTATSTITTSWAAPVTPTATVSTDPDTLAASVTVTSGTGTPATDTLMVVRVSPDGTRHVLADDLESGDTVTDPLPPLGVEYAYEVTGIAATGVPSEPATVAHTNVTTYWAMNFGTGAAEVVLARFNPKASYSMEQGGELYHFADGGEGDGLPVWYGTTEREIGGSVSWDTLTQATADRLNALMLRYPVGWLRDPFGHRWRAHMKPKFSHGIGRLWQVAIDWDAVRWVES